jgi:hypothetical protein
MIKRQQMLLIQGVVIAIAVVLVVIGGSRVLAVWKLADVGKEAMATVTARHAESCGSRGVTWQVHTLAADGQQFHLGFAQGHAVGEKMLVTYLPQDISVVVPGPKTGSRWDKMLFRVECQKDDIALGAGGVLILILGLGGLIFTAMRKPGGNAPGTSKS